MKKKLASAPALNTIHFAPVRLFALAQLVGGEWERRKCQRQVYTVNQNAFFSRTDTSPRNFCRAEQLVPSHATLKEASRAERNSLRTIHVPFIRKLHAKGRSLARAKEKDKNKALQPVKMSGRKTSLKYARAQCHVRFVLGEGRPSGVHCCAWRILCDENADTARTLRECCACTQVLTLCSALGAALLAHTRAR